MRRAKPLLLALVAALLLVCTESRAQGENEPGGETTSSETAVEADEEETEPIEEVSLILAGAWSLLSDDLSTSLTPSMLDTALQGCFKPMEQKSLKVQPGAASELPPPSQLVGAVSYYQTESGLQRLDILNGTLLLISQAEKRQTDTGRTIWQLSGNSVRLQLTFAVKKTAASDLTLMIEGNRLLMKCPALPEDGKQQREDGNQQED